MYAAIRALEAAEVLTWVNRLVRVQFRELDLFGKMALRSRLVRTSNAYVFRDPLPWPGAPGRGEGRGGQRTGRFPMLHLLSRKIPLEPEIKIFNPLSKDRTRSQRRARTGPFAASKTP